MANRRISDLPLIAGQDLADDDLFTVVHVYEVDPNLKNKKLTVSGTKDYLNIYYLPRSGGTVSGSVTFTGNATISGLTTTSGLAVTTTAIYANNTAAKAGGLVDGNVYRKSDGTLMVVYT